MTREIKFRAWDKGKKRMMVVPKIHFGADGDGKTITLEYESEDGFYIGLIAGETCELMQFTGLKDKNGKDVYEGDIVKNDQYSLVKWPLQIRWQEGVGWVFGSEWPWIAGYDIGNIHLTEIIGNIYENPELIK